MTAPGAQVWRGSDVKLSEVLGHLDALRAAAAHEEIEDRNHIHPRNSVMDLVLVASDPAEAKRAAAVVEVLASRHPCRAIVVLGQPEGRISRIDATITSVSHTVIGGVVCQYEQVFLHVRGPAADHIPSLVDSLLIPDVVNYLWWTGSAPLGERRLAESLAAADVLLLDSARFERPFESFIELAALAAENSETAFGDFHWARLEPWREGLAQFFNPDDRRGFLRGVGALGIDYVAEGRGNRSAAVLLAGWLGSSLGWTLKRAAAGRGGVVVAHLVSPAKHPVEVAMRPVEMDGFASGEVTAVRVDAVSRAQTCLLRAVRDGAHSAHVVVDGDLRGRPLPRHVLPMPPREESDLLSRLLIEARGDRVYPRALRLGAEILRAVRP